MYDTNAPPRAILSGFGVRRSAFSVLVLWFSVPGSGFSVLVLWFLGLVLGSMVTYERENRNREPENENPEPENPEPRTPNAERRTPQRPAVKSM